MKRRELILLGGAILAALVYLAVKPDKRIAYDLSGWTPPPPGMVRSILYGLKGGQTRLTLREGTWYLPGDKPADPARMARLLRTLEEAVLLDKLSDREDYRRFGLAEGEAALLEFAAEGGAPRSFYYGKAAPGGGSYVRLPGRSGVFSLKGDYRALLPENPEELRDRSVLRFDKTRLRSLLLRQGSRSLRLQREEDGTWLSEGEPFAGQERLEGILSSLSQLRCLSYEEEAPSGEPFLELLIQGERSRFIRFYDEREEGYRALSSDGVGPFLSPRYPVDALQSLFP